jgi:PleD family two-component response regulator
MSNRRTLVALDEDSQTLREIEDILSEWFDVTATRSPQRALIAVQSNPTVFAIVTSHSLKGATGLAVLRAAQTLKPNVRRVLLASAGQLAEVIDGLHSGTVDRVAYRPIRAGELAATVGACELRATA